MAIFRLSAQVFGRSAGRNAVRCAAYRAGEELQDERTEEKYSYTNKQGIAHTEIMAPEGAPEWAYDRQTLWNRVEQAERRRDAQVAREVLLSLPVELSEEGQLALVRAFVREEFVARGMVADFAIHRAREENPHVHVMLTVRELGPQGFGKKERAWNSRKALVQWRMAWEHYANQALAREGHSARIDHRSLAARGLSFTAAPKRLGSERGRQQRGAQLNRLRAWRKVARENGRLIERDPSEAISALTGNQSTFTRTELYRFLNGKTVGAEQFNRCLHAVLAHSDLVRIGIDDSGEERFTSRRVLHAEQLIATSGKQLASRVDHTVEERYRRQALASRSLSDDQRRAFDHITQATGDLALVEGYAGTGKSYMLGAAREAWEAQGYVVVGAALAGKAAQGLEAGSKISSRTLASWEYAWDSGKHGLTRRHVLVIDEAAMIGTAQMARVLERARKAGAKVVLVGDSRQLQAVDAGAPMRILGASFGSAVMSDIRRQKIEWQKAATRAFASGKTERGLEAYAAHGDVHEHRLQADARAAVVAAWQRDRATHPGETQIILSFRRADVRALNEDVRALRRRSGELGRDHVVSVVGRDGERESRSFARGDRVYFLKNDRNLGVANGSLGTLERITIGGEVVVRLDEGGTVAFNLRDYSSLDYGYAATIHKGQGVTASRAYVLASKAFDANATYVAMSRHEKAVELHWSHEEFQPPWEQARVESLRASGDATFHASEQEAVAGALQSWSDGDGQAVLVVADKAGRDQLNLAARDIARRLGRLGEQSSIRTRSGVVDLAVGDRLRMTEAIEEEGLSRGSLGTLVRFRAQVITVALDDGRTIDIDTRKHRGVDYGYATLLDDAGSLGRCRPVVLAVSEDESDLQLVRGLGARLGGAAIHSIASPDPSRDGVFKVLSRVREKETAREVQSQVGAAHAFDNVADLRGYLEHLSPLERPAYFAYLQHVASQPSRTHHEALFSMPEVRDAVAEHEKAQIALSEAREYRAAFRLEASLPAKLGDWIGKGTEGEIERAEAELHQAKQRLDALINEPGMAARAKDAAGEHNRRRGQAHELLASIQKQRQADSGRDPGLENELPRFAQRLAARMGRTVWVARDRDYDAAMTFLGAVVSRGHRLVICTDTRGDLVVFNGKRSSLDGIAQNTCIRVSRSGTVEVTDGGQGRGLRSRD